MASSDGRQAFVMLAAVVGPEVGEASGRSGAYCGRRLGGWRLLSCSVDEGAIASRVTIGVEVEGCGGDRGRRGRNGCGVRGRGRGLGPGRNGCGKQQQIGQAAWKKRASAGGDGACAERAVRLSSTRGTARQNPMPSRSGAAPPAPPPPPLASAFFHPSPPGCHPDPHRGQRVWAWRALANGLARWAGGSVETAQTLRQWAGPASMPPMRARWFARLAGSIAARAIRGLLAPCQTSETACLCVAGSDD